MHIFDLFNSVGSKVGEVHSIDNDNDLGCFGAILGIFFTIAMPLGCIYMWVAMPQYYQTFTPEERIYFFWVCIFLIISLIIAWFTVHEIGLIKFWIRTVIYASIPSIIMATIVDGSINIGGIIVVFLALSVLAFLPSLIAYALHRIFDLLRKKG